MISKKRCSEIVSGVIKTNPVSTAERLLELIKNELKNDITGSKREFE